MKWAAVVLSIDLAGTFLFGIEGATDAIVNRLDLFGILVLSFVTALGGGVIRDLLIGFVPPSAVVDWRYGTLAFAGAIVTFVFFSGVRQVPPILLTVLDAAGLSLFAMAGAGKAQSRGIGDFGTVLMGVITGSGGGAVRDVFLARIPNVLRADVYASAALAGVVVMIIGVRFRMPPQWAAALGGSVCFTLRMLSVAYGWNLPSRTVF